MTPAQISRAAEKAVRQSYGRLVAMLSKQTRDMAAAEDALADALKSALESWPITGVPRVPEAWLMTTARRKLLDGMRHTKVVEATGVSLLALADRAQESLVATDRIPDHRLELMFACCHPDVDPDIRTPLMLQAILGIDAASIASAFLVAPSTMGQRLSRAKARIRENGIAFELPERREMPARLSAVLSSIYIAFSLGMDSANGNELSGEGFAEEAIFLSRLLATLLPQEPEVLGLAALQLHVHARRNARFLDGCYQPLAEQDPALWDMAMIAEAEGLLLQAGNYNMVGRFQLEAAIQSVHAGRVIVGETDWNAIAQLYDGLVRLWPSMGALVGRAVALSQVHGANHGLVQLEAIAIEAIGAYQPYWAAKADLLHRAGCAAEACEAYDRAIGLARSMPVRAFLMRQKATAER